MLEPMYVAAMEGEKGGTFPETATRWSLGPEEGLMKYNTVDPSAA